MTKNKPTFFLGPLIVAILLLAGIFSAALLSRYAFKVSSSEFLSIINKKLNLRIEGAKPLPIRNSYIIGIFSTKNQRIYISSQRYSSMTAFYSMLVDDTGEIQKKAIIKKIGLSPFSPFLNDAQLSNLTESFQPSQNTIVGAITIRNNFLNKKIKSDNKEMKK